MVVFNVSGRVCHSNLLPAQGFTGNDARNLFFNLISLISASVLTTTFSETYLIHTDANHTSAKNKQTAGWLLLWSSHRKFNVFVTEDSATHNRLSKMCPQNKAWSFWAFFDRESASNIAVQWNKAAHLQLLSKEISFPVPRYCVDNH